VLGTSNAIFQIPNQVGLQPTGLDGIVGLGPQDPSSGNFLLNANGATGFASGNLDERQREITHYGILSYLHTVGSLDYQVSLFGRYSSLFFTPGNNVGDILYNGLAQTAYKRDAAYGLQAEGVWRAFTGHTIRFGVLYQADDTLSRTNSAVLTTAPGGPGVTNPNPLCTDPDQTCQTSAVPLTIADNGSKHGYNYGFYVQDEWALTDNFTVNYGLRYDAFSAFDAENQLSPRINGVWKPTDNTTMPATRVISRHRLSSWWRARMWPCSTIARRRAAAAPTTRQGPSAPTISISASSRKYSATGP
jgi:outer membrane receptor protein involved in Fe transport